MDIDWQGAQQFAKRCRGATFYFAAIKRSRWIAVYAAAGKIAKRALPNEWRKRLRNEPLRRAYDYLIVNDDFDTALSDENIISR
ncbi:hypothetical protein KCP75_19860 [Salmonella enterica subsp. enterica]|nr:hypothetical protein KCP75_19860 [Salmonella enterica subsp. enterica]